MIYKHQDRNIDIKQAMNDLILSNDECIQVFGKPQLSNTLESQYSSFHKVNMFMILKYNSPVDVRSKGEVGNH